MDESISSADANRNFSSLLRGVRERGARYVVTSHGKAVARIVPIDDDHGGADRAFARDALSRRQQAQPVQQVGSYSRDELYERGLTNDVLAIEVIKKVGKDYVIADSSEPKSIAELNRHGVNARGAKKGKDSVEHGIQWLQQQTIVVDTRCINLQNELRTYKWKEDAAGNPLNVPVDRFNHGIDGIRYACLGRLFMGNRLIKTSRHSC